MNYLYEVDVDGGKVWALMGEPDPDKKLIVASEDYGIINKAMHDWAVQQHGYETFDIVLHTEPQPTVITINSGFKRFIADKDLVEVVTSRIEAFEEDFKSSS